jgi:hypothetical protein
MAKGSVGKLLLGRFTANDANPIAGMTHGIVKQRWFPVSNLERDAWQIWGGWFPCYMACLFWSGSQVFPTLRISQKQSSYLGEIQGMNLFATEEEEDEENWR